MSQPVTPERMCQCACHEDGEPWCNACFSGNHTIAVPDDLKWLRGLDDGLIDRVLRLEAKAATIAQLESERDHALDMAKYNFDEFRKANESQAATIADIEHNLSVAIEMNGVHVDTIQRQATTIERLIGALYEIRETCVGPEAWKRSYAIAAAALSKQAQP